MFLIRCLWFSLSKCWVPEGRGQRDLQHREEGAEPGEPVDGELLDVAKDVHVQRHAADKTETKKKMCQPEYIEI